MIISYHFLRGALGDQSSMTPFTLKSCRQLQGGEEGEDGGPFELKPAKALVSRLYGEWQTERWVPPRAVGGVVPKDARGGVKVPPMSAGLPTVRPPSPLGVILAARVAMSWVLVSAPV